MTKIINLKLLVILILILINNKSFSVNSNFVIATVDREPITYLDLIEKSKLKYYLNNKDNKFHNLKKYFGLSVDKNIKDIISLTYDQRFIRRKKVKSDNGIEFLVNLPETKSLNPGQAFELDNLDLIKVLAKVEDLLEIKGNNLMQLIWHIGNRHIPCQIEKDRVLIQFDKVIGDMILRLGGKINQVKESFNPEGGAYGMGRTHGHKH